MYLTIDVFSQVNPKKKYASKGDKIQVVNYHGSIVTCLISEGSGFPVKAEYLSPSKK